jgi:bla regulator protein BlaR1
VISKSLPAIWEATANHLWQSTLFVVAAGLVTLSLRKNRAQVRYCIWLTSSVKFLVPLSLLTWLGSHLAILSSPLRIQPGFYYAIEQVSQPFAQREPRVISSGAHPTDHSNLVYMLSVIFTVAWLCGFFALLFIWWVRWRRVSAMMRHALPLSEGREVEVLRRVERIGRVWTPIKLLASRADLEPAICGIASSALIWPEGISERLQDAELEAILTHEVWHVRRRDNLTAAMHTAVETVFWFHPLVWWLGARLVEERERACDEEVLQSGHEPQIYAESILKTCQFCVESPRACAAGVTGAHLKERITRIMTQPLADQLSFARKLLLATIGISAVAGPVVFGMVNATQVRAQLSETSGAPLPSLEIVAVKPNHSGDKTTRFGLLPDRFTVTNVSVKDLIKYAYGVKDYQLSRAPSWIDHDRYDVDLKEKDSPVTGAQNFNADVQQRRRLMVQALLADRFQLKVHQEIRDLPTYALVVGNNGPKFSQTPGPVPVLAGGRIMILNGHLSMTALPVSALAGALSEQFGRSVIDETGLTGNYDLNLQWTAGSKTPTANGTENGSQEPANMPLLDSSESSILTAVQEQLGLQLEPQRGPVQFLVIDHAERPSEN